MRWFKHMTDASDDEFMILIEAEFGLAGYARWFKILEEVGRKMDKSDRCAAAFPWNVWQTKLKGKPKLLRTFLERLANLQRIKLKETGNVLEIEVPKLLKIRDEYSKKSGHNQEPDRTNSGAKNKNTESDTESEKPPVVPLEGDTTPKKRSEKRATRLTDDWEPTPRDIEWARDRYGSMDLEYQTERFKNHHIGKGTKYVDWSRTWKNWISGRFVSGKVVEIKTGRPGFQG